MAFQSVGSGASRAIRAHLMEVEKQRQQMLDGLLIENTLAERQR
jgi:hypothetical protein